MAIVRAVKSGVWSDTTVWNTGALPTSADDVYSNTFTVTIDVSPTVLSISNASATGVTAGGGFVISANGITLTCTAANGIVGGIANVTVCLDVTVGLGSLATVVGNIIAGGGGTSPGVRLNGLGTLNVVGNCTGGPSNGASPGLTNNAAGVVNITGNAIAAGPNFGAINQSTGTINITGNIGGVSNNSTGVVNITGPVTPATTNPGIANNSGTLTVIGQMSSVGSAAALSSSGATATNILTGPFLTNSTGVNPVYAARWFWANSNVTPTYYQIRTVNLATIRPLYTADSVGGNPAASNVRSGTVYGPNNELTGTCAVPPAGSVALGVPVDNTTGTAALTAANIRSALGMASANLDTQLAPLPNLDTTVSSRLASAAYTTPPTATQNASAVRTELSTELGRIDVATSTRSTFNSATDTVANVTLVATTTNLTNPPDVPTTSEIADAVRVELTPELNRLDADVSSRLASGDYTTPPTALQNAEAVRIELTPELDRIDTTVSSRSTFNPATDTVAQVALVDVTTDLTNPPVVPTPEQIAEAVREELEPELERVANCATVATTGEQIQDAWARSPSTP